MGFINARMGDAPEPTIPPEGMYDLRIQGAEFDRNKADTRDMHSIFMVIEGDEDYVGVNHWLVWPTEADWEEDSTKAKRMTLSNKRFLAMFGIEFTSSGFDDDALEGAVCRAALKLEANDEGQHFPRVIVPRPAD